MKKKGILIALLCMLLTAVGCQQQSEEEVKPQRSPSDTVKLYLDAIKAEDGLAMAQLTVDHSGMDFTISEAEAQGLGLDQANLQKLYAEILAFDYTIEQEIVHDHNAEISVNIQAYDINQVINDIVTKNEEAFGEINGEDADEKAKNQKIADIMIAEFAKAEKTSSFTVVFHLQLVDQTWLIQAEDASTLITQLFNSKSNT